MKKLFLVLSFLFITVLIACEVVQHTVTFELNGGSPEIDEITVNKGEFINEPVTVSKPGYRFMGWYTDVKQEGNWDFKNDQVKTDITLEAQWEEIVLSSKTIVFNTNEGSTINNASVTEGALLNVPNTPTKEGYEFAGWYKDSNLTQPWNFAADVVNNDMTLNAKWKLASDYTKSLKILSIGNSFSEDAHKYLFEIAKSYGIPQENIVIANMYIGGAELVQHYNNSTNNAKSYQYQLFKNGVRNNVSNVSLGEAIGMEVWDVITFQQASHHSGLSDMYKDYTLRLSRWVDALAINPEVKIGWHMTWAYQQTSNHSGFGSYDRNQNTMYNMILETTKEKILSVPQVQFVIPSGTSIQNARTSYVGDSLTHDGYHLTDPLGRYIAGLTFFKSVTGFEVSKAKIEFKPQGVSEQDQLMAMEAVNNAFAKPYEVTNSTYNEKPDAPVIETKGVKLAFSFVQGFWADNATSVSPETDAIHKNYAAVTPIAKALLPVGSEIVIEPGFQYRVIFLEKSGDGYKVVQRGGNLSIPYTVIDEAFWGQHQYVAFNISSVPTVNISDKIAEVAGKLSLYHPEGTGEGHIDLELSYEMGEYQKNGDLPTASTSKFVSMPLTPQFFKTNDFISVTEGYEFSIVSLVYENGYKVVDVSEYQTSKLEITETFKSDHIIISIMVKRVDEAVIDTDINKIVSIKPATILHVDQELFFTPGFWADNAASILTEDTAFNNRFAATNVLSKSSFKGLASIIVEEGYQIRYNFMSYDGYGNYKVIKRSNNFTNTFLIGENFWQNYEYISFNISKIDNSSVLEIVDQLSRKLTFTAELSFISGYWNDNAAAIMSTDTTAKSFIAASPVGRSVIKPGTIITLAPGYQARIVILNFLDDKTFKVVKRTDNLTGKNVLTNAIYGTGTHIAFNVSKVPTSDITSLVEETSTKITLSVFTDQIVRHEDKSLSFVSGYWNNGGIKVTNSGSSFDLGFAASNVVSMDSIKTYESITIAQGYQVRVVFMDYSFNTYSVLLRTDNLTGTISLTEEQKLKYQYVAFNISSTPTSNLSEHLESLESKITFNS